MKKEEILKVEIAHEIPERGWFYASVALPATQDELEDALQRARVTGPEHGLLEVGILGCEVWPELLFYRMDTVSLEELQFFAERLSGMDSMERVIFKAVAPVVLGKPSDGLLSIKDLINCTYGLDEVIVAADIGSDEQLGELVIETEMNEQVNEVPEHLLYLLDRKRIGETQRKTDGGVYAGELYIAAGEYELPKVYDGKTLPGSQKTDHPRPVFELELSMGQGQKEEEAVMRISLPAEESEVRCFMSSLRNRVLKEAVHFQFASSVPQITAEHFSGISEIESWNRLAEKIQGASLGEMVMFKAVLSAEKPNGLMGIRDIMDNLHQYELLCEVNGSDEFFKEYLAHHLDDSFDREWLSTLLTWTEGANLLERLGASNTDYGVVSGRGRFLFEAVRYSMDDEAGQESLEEAHKDNELEQQNLSGITQGM